MRLGSWQCLCSTTIVHLYDVYMYDTGITTPLNLNVHINRSSPVFEKEKLLSFVLQGVCTGVYL